MTIKSDRWIREMAVEHGMIEPFADRQVRDGAISYGLSSYGYDMRVADEFRIFHNALSPIVDPKAFDERSFVELTGDSCIIPPNSFALARSVEYFRIPRDVLTLCVGKSTYARCFRGDTRVALVDGATPTLEQMARRADEGESFFGYSVGLHGRIIVTRLDSPRYIDTESLLEIVLDNGRRIRCTPDHRFLRRDGRTAPAVDLRPGDSLMPLYRKPVRGYEAVYQPLDGHLDPTHRLADEWNVRNGIDPDAPGEGGRALSARAQATQERREKQHRTPRVLRLRKEITARVARRAPDEAGSIRGAARSLRCDRSVFRRFPDVPDASRGRRRKRNHHSVVAVHELPGDHDVFCLTVPEAGNFALAAGVFVRNCGIITNVTPFEPEWEGYVTLEISNTTPLPAKIYANEGIAQVLFFQSDEACETSYADKAGKYQKQVGVTPPRP